MNSSQYNALIQRIKAANPALYEALKLIGAEVIRTQLEVFGPEGAGLDIQDDAPSPPPVLNTFTYELLPDNILLSWTLASGSAARYEIREGGTSYETANTVIQTDTSSARIDPLTEGTHRYWIKGISDEGVYSVDALFVDIIIPTVGGFSVTAQVIDNNVLLYWSQPTSSFRISSYILRRNGIQFGTTNSTFSAIFENVAGTYEYSVQAVDIAGNLSPEAIVIAAVTQPPDYELRADFLSDLDGTKTEVWLTPGPRLLCNVRTETYQDHFSSRGWSTIQDQINAGFPLYIQPSAPVGEYVEVIDFGLVISSTVLSINYNTVLIAGSGVNVVLEIETSIDDITYTAPVVASTLFVASLRYARLTFTFTAID